MVNCTQILLLELDAANEKRWGNEPNGINESVAIIDRYV